MKWMGHINRWGRIEEFALYEKILYKKGRESLWIVYTTRQPLIIKTLQQQIWLKFLPSTLCLNTSCWLYHIGMTRQKVSTTQHSMMALLQQAWQDYSFYNSLHHNGPTTASMTRLKFLWVNISWWPHHKAMTRLKFLCLKISWWPYHSKDEKTKVSTTQHVIMALSQQAWQD